MWLTSSLLSTVSLFALLMDDNDFISNDNFMSPDEVSDNNTYI